MKEDYLKGLNPEQLEAVKTVEGPLLVLAGAGTGKTSVITRRIAHILSLGVPPEQILAVTFTNKAAREMLNRVREILGWEKCRGLTISTFHSWCARFLRQHAEHLGYSKKYTIYTTGDQLGLLQEIAKDKVIAGMELDPRYILSKISWTKAQGISEKTFKKKYNSEDKEAIEYAFAQYCDQLKTLDAMDFDDLLTKTLDILKKIAFVRDGVQRQYQYIMVDEYQDTNHPQYELIQLLSQEHRNICAVGDDDQSIYGFRGAQPGTILKFDKDFEGAKLIRLEQNYRSVNAILKRANQVISNNSERHDKNLKSDFGEGAAPEYYIDTSPIEEADRIAGMILAERAEKVAKREIDVWKDNHFWGDTAVLIRSSYLARELETAFRQKDIPYNLVGGQSFYERKEIADLMGYLRLIANSGDDAAFLRTVNSPPRGIGSVSIRKISKAARKANQHYLNFMNGEKSKTLGINEKALAKFNKFSELITKFKKRFRDTPLDIAIRELARDLNYRVYLRDISKNIREAEGRWQRVQMFFETLAQNEKRFLEEGIKQENVLEHFIQEQTLSPEQESEEQADRFKVQLMTVHAAKGLEFPNLFVVGLEEGLFPHQRAIEAGETDEERRLCYVAVTRAKNRLVLTRCRTRTVFGQTINSEPSRFLTEMGFEEKDAPEEEKSPKNTKNSKKTLKKDYMKYLKNIKSKLK